MEAHIAKPDHQLICVCCRYGEMHVLTRLCSITVSTGMRILVEELEHFFRTGSYIIWNNHSELCFTAVFFFLFIGGRHISISHKEPVFAEQIGLRSKPARLPLTCSGTHSEIWLAIERGVVADEFCGTVIDLGAGFLRTERRKLQRRHQRNEHAFPIPAFTSYTLAFFEQRKRLAETHVFFFLKHKTSFCCEYPQDG